MKTINTAVVLATLLNTGNVVDAFAPSSFTPKSSSITSANPSRIINNGSALQMNLFDRFSRVAKSNINNVLKNLEDPEKILNQAVEDMQADLVKVRQSYAEVTATQRRLLKQQEQANAIAEDWYTRAQLALKASNEELAREALNRRQQQLDTASDLQSQIDVQNMSIDKLYDGMQALESKIIESKAKKEQMIARARTAETTQKVNDMLSGVTGKTSMDAFTRMEDKVEALEAAAEVSSEMGSLGGNALPGSSSADLEKQFKMLEGSSAVDDELKKMKGMLSGSSSAPDKKKDNLDDELAKLKKEAGL